MLDKVVYDSGTHGFYVMDSHGRTRFVHETHVGDSISNAVRQHGFMANPVKGSLAYKRLCA